MGIKCRLIAIEERSPGVFVALLVRLSDHPRLGLPNGRVTQTSVLQNINFATGRINTMNSVYTFKEG